MAYDPNTTHGLAHQSSFMEVALSGISEITNDEEPTSVALPGEGRRFAHLMYQVNAAPLNLSGDVIIDTDNLELINENGFATLSAQFDTGLKDQALTILIEADGDFTWVAEALPGTTTGAASWRVKRLEDTTVGSLQTIRTLWADGNGNFDNTATPPLSSLTYS